MQTASDCFFIRFISDPASFLDNVDLRNDQTSEIKLARGPKGKDIGCL